MEQNDLSLSRPSTLHYSSEIHPYVGEFPKYLCPHFYHILLATLFKIYKTKISRMEKINAIITGVGGYVPDYVLTNDEISKMVDTTDEWIMGRIGIKERRILKDEGLGTSYIARKAAKQLIQRTRTNPDDIDPVSYTHLTLPTTPYV